jgi:hypothetical protein
MIVEHGSLFASPRRDVTEAQFEGNRPITGALLIVDSVLIISFDQASVRMIDSVYKPRNTVIMSWMLRRGLETLAV